MAAAKQSQPKQEGEPEGPKTSNWPIVWPVYIDSKKTYKQGRRLPLSKCVSTPTPQELGEAAKSLGLTYVVELNKCYPRDFFLVGRLRVKLKNEDGTFVHPEIHTKEQLMKHLCVVLSKSTTRQASQNSTETSTQTAGKPTKKKKRLKKTQFLKFFFQLSKTDFPNLL